MSTATPSPARPTTSSTTSTSKRRRKIAKFALAGVAIVGVGAALTSAAWTDDVFFSADAEAGTFELQGSLDGSSWQDADNSGLAIVIPATAFENLAPGDTRTVTLHLQNSGSVDMSLGAPAITPTGGLFAVGGATATAGAYAGGATLTAGGTTTFDVTVAAPNWTNQDFVGATGSIVVQVTGTSA